MIVILLSLKRSIAASTLNIMKNACFQSILTILVCVFLHTASLKGQNISNEAFDSPQTMEWVMIQAGRIDTALANAMRGTEPIEILVKLADCYILFDAVALAGVYCTDVRVAAEAGRKQCDVINYRLEKDLNSKLQRAVDARREAVMMREAAEICLRMAQKAERSKIAPMFTPSAVIQQDARLAQMDLSDGLASRDLHIMAQKTEHAIQLLHDIGHLATTLFYCEPQVNQAKNAIRQCERILAAPNWTEVHKHTNEAMQTIEQIIQYKGCQ
jgi:hypothetical protein